jgi:signal peptidase I
MKKAITIIILSILFITMGCSKESKPTLNKSPYKYETAIKNGDIVGFNGGKYNIKKLDQFMENVKKGKKDRIRITTYTTEGGAIITDLEYDGKNINYTCDNTRDGFGVPIIEKKKFDGDSIYKSGSSYYLKNKPEDIFII